MYKQIVVGTDGAAGANPAVDAAIELVRLTDAPLHVVNAHKVTTAYQLAAATEINRTHTMRIARRRQPRK